MTESLLPKRFLFHFALPCQYRAPVWSPQIDALDAGYRLANLAELETVARGADFRMAWSEEGLAFAAYVTGKQQPPWCRTSRPEDSDGVQIWIDTRDVHNVHRAGRFCHRFLFMPVGGGSRLDQPVAQWMPINRAKEHPKAIKPGSILIRSRRERDGYLLEGFLPAEALTGYDPSEYPRLGFTYAIIDRELGEQTLGVGNPMPYQDDPGLWTTLELVR